MSLLASSELASVVPRWSRYPAYRNSGVGWLGQIPAHWEVKRLKNIVRLNPESLAETTRPEHVIQYVDISNVEEVSGISPSQEMRFEDAPSRARRVVRSGDTILSTVRTYLKAIAYFEEPPGNLIVSTGFAVLRPVNAVAPRYLYALVRCKEFVEMVVAHSVGVGYPAINPSELSCLPVWLPSPSEQRAIVAFLDRETAKIDALVKKKERLIDLLQEKRTAGISQAVTKGLDPNVPMKDSGVEWLGRIPAHWDVRRLRYVASILRGKFSHRPRNDPALYDGAYPFIQTGDVAASRKYITSYEQTLNEAGFAVSKQFPKGTLVMAIAANIGDLAILGFPACFPDSIVGFVPREGVVLEYLFCNLTAMRAEMVNAATENTQMNLNVDRISALSTVLPSQNEQHDIVEFLDREISKIDALISKVREGIEKLKEYRTALISATVTGKIDVRGEATTAS